MRINTQEERDRTIMTIQSLSNPAPRSWLQGEIGKVLVHYFVGVIPKNFSKSIGSDYDAELSDFPAWAIVKARRWWVSRDNEYRFRKPLPGDLGERVLIEMKLVRYAEGMVRLFDSNGSNKAKEPPRKPVRREDMEARRAYAKEVMSGFSKIAK